MAHKDISFGYEVKRAAQHWRPISRGLPGISASLSALCGPGRPGGSGLRASCTGGPCCQAEPRRRTGHADERQKLVSPSDRGAVVEAIFPERGAMSRDV